MKIQIILFLVLFSNLTFGQDWCSWNFSYKFKIHSKINVYEIISTDFYINDQYYDMNSLKHDAKEKALKYNSVSEEYKLNLTYGCISCGYERAKEPPDVYLKIKLKNYRIGRPFELFIPIYVEKKKEINESWMLTPINIGTIILSEFVDGYTIGNNQEIFPAYEAIEVKKDNSIVKYREGEYQMKRMNKMVKLEVENENK